MIVPVSQSLVNKLARDPAFLVEFPQFRGVQLGMTKIPGGCNGCKKANQVIVGAVRNFNNVVESLDQVALGRLKQRLGAGKLQLNKLNRSTGKGEVKVL